MPLVPTPSAAPESRVLRVLTWVAFVVACITDFGYWLIIRVQESQPPDVLTVPFVAGYIALMAGLLGISVTNRRRVVRWRPALRAGAAAGLTAMGVLALSTALPSRGSGRGGGRAHRRFRGVGANDRVPSDRVGVGRRTGLRHGRLPLRMRGRPAAHALGLLQQRWLERRCAGKRDHDEHLLGDSDRLCRVRNNSRKPSTLGERPRWPPVTWQRQFDDKDRQLLIADSRKSQPGALGSSYQRGGNNVISTSCNGHRNAVPAARWVPELAGRTGRARLLVRKVRASLEPATGSASGLAPCRGGEPEASRPRLVLI